MLKSILVGLDGSACSSTAVGLGLRWRRDADALLVGLGSSTPRRSAGPSPCRWGPASSRSSGTKPSWPTPAGRWTVPGAVRPTLREAGLACKVLEDTGLPCEQIVLEAQRYDLVLLGHETHFHFETQDRVDDTLVRVLKNSPRPVVAVQETPGGDGPVVVAYDGSLQAARALQAFQASGLGRTQEVHIVSVAADHVEAARRADRAADYLRFHGINPPIHALASAAPPARVILDQVRRLNAGLVVMGAYGQPVLREFFLGSATRTLLKEAPVPLFLYH